VLVRCVVPFALFDDISGIAKDLEEGEGCGVGEQNYSPFARRQLPVPDRRHMSAEVGGKDFGKTA
ncbi:MAG UNVERIFIED_CONTAM: hypothetical protein MIJ72_10500, partial [Staphylococcus saprophyticus]